MGGDRFGQDGKEEDSKISTTIFTGGSSNWGEGTLLNSVGRRGNCRSIRNRPDERGVEDTLPPASNKIGVKKTLRGSSDRWEGARTTVHRYLTTKKKNRGREYRNFASQSLRGQQQGKRRVFLVLSTCWTGGVQEKIKLTKEQANWGRNRNEKDNPLTSKKDTGEER